MVKNVIKNPGRLLDNTANIATPAAIYNPKNVFSTIPEVIKFYHTGKGLYLGKFVKFIFYKWKKKQIDYTHLHH